jgi:hypothetical protein
MGDDGKDHDGVGQGVLRVYTDLNGEVVGYSWSTSPNSSFLDQSENHLVIGRLNHADSSQDAADLADTADNGYMVAPNDIASDQADTSDDGFMAASNNIIVPEAPASTPTATDSGGDEVSAPSAVSSPITAKGESLAAVLDQMDVEHHWLAFTKLNNPDVDGSPLLDDDGVPVETSVTHCDAFVKRACDLLGAPMTAGEGSHDHANQQYDWLEEQAESHSDANEAGWHEVTGLEAQSLANQGGVVVAATRNTAGKPGHVAMVRPSTKDIDTILAEGPQIAQAGQENYNSTSVAQGFNHHPGAWGDTEGSNTPVRFFYYLPAS